MVHSFNFQDIRDSISYALKISPIHIGNVMLQLHVLEQIIL